VPQVRLIGADGDQLGIVEINDALKRAQEATSTWSRSLPARSRR